MNIRWSFGWGLTVLIQLIFYLMGNYKDEKFVGWVILISLCMFTFSYYFEKLLYAKDEPKDELNEGEEK